jgi:hypothetical protein
MPAVEWLPIAISLVSLATSVLALVRSQQVANRTEAAARKRAEGRRAVGAAIDTGNRLVIELRTRTLSGPDEVQSRYEAFEHQAHQAIERADATLLGFYHREIDGSPRLTGIISERLRRLHEILDRL